MAVLRAEKYLNRKAQFALVYNKGASWSNKAMVLRAVPNGLELARYGFTVSRRVGNAVVRNRVKRLLREILRQLPVKVGWDMVFIARIAATKMNYTEVEQSVGSLLNRAGLVAGGHEENRPGVN
jgi:ribonuclease P protein component